MSPVVVDRDQQRITIIDPVTGRTYTLVVDDQIAVHAEDGSQFSRNTVAVLCIDGRSCALTDVRFCRVCERGPWAPDAVGFCKTCRHVACFACLKTTKDAYVCRLCTQQAFRRWLRSI